MQDKFDAYREALQKLIDTVCHVVCYIRRDANLLQAIEDYCRDLPVVESKDLNEKAYWMLYSLKDYPRCQFRECNSRVSFRGLKKGYSTACCNSHAQIVARPKTAATNLRKFGSTTPLQNKEIRAQINQHNLETYGTLNVVESEYFKKKRVETCRDNFGVDWPMQSEEIQAKSRKKCKEKYGVEYVLQSDYAKEKGKETSKELYGTDNPAQSDVVKAKSRKTFQDNYGVNAPAQCPEIRRKQQYRYTFNGKSFDSSIEIAFYIWLKDHNMKFEYQPNVKFQYEYDGEIHWYIPDFKVNDKLIELKGDHFFDENGMMFNPYDPSHSNGTKAKYQCMLKNNVQIIKMSEMKDILKYIKDTYGKNYLKQFHHHFKNV